ncbi:MAG TPA: hypothetical protein VKQ36_14100 [Ktedonobacterales bacterium]|nr:hypothetical protein [Ktedonobacterales bacterium]
MNLLQPIVNALKATYNFFVGDVILLGATAVAFGLATIILRVAFPAGSATGNVLGALTLIAIVVIGLVATLARELASRKR